MNQEQKKRYNERAEMARTVCSELSPKYKVNICSYDATAVEVHNITDKQHSELCKKLRCSGHYSEITQKGYLTNFGKYN